MSQVLVVEDYEDARAMVELILEDAGYQVLLAADGVEGVTMARRTRRRGALCRRLCQAVPA
ncbi:MAG TPA: hypothetical protein VFO31_04790 [Vicinamibacterales bacterium]|nr:hypothetical protein [Vicinamibacterales bacterium]